MENRSDPRYKSNAPVTYSLFSSGKAPAFAANAHNCSESGLGFQSAFPLRPGQYICVRTKPVLDEFFPDRGEEAVLKSFSLAQVRWCRKNGAAKIAGYDIGVKYL